MRILWGLGGVCGWVHGAGWNGSGKGLRWPLDPAPATLPRPLPPQFLEGELKQTYSSKNFALKAKLLDLSKKFRAQIDGDANVAALWGDVEALLVRARPTAAAGKLGGVEEGHGGPAGARPPGGSWREAGGGRNGVEEGHGGRQQLVRAPPAAAAGKLDGEGFLGGLGPCWCARLPTSCPRRHPMCRRRSRRAPPSV